MKKIFLLMLFYLTMLFCSCSLLEDTRIYPQFFDIVYNSETKSISGLIINGELDDYEAGDYQHIMVYLEGGGTDKWLESDSGGYTFPLRFNSDFEIVIANAPAKKAVLFLLPSDIICTNLEDAKKNSLDTTEIETPVTYNIRYSLNYHSDAEEIFLSEKTIKRERETAILTTYIPTRRSYTFLGWDKDKSATEPEYPTGHVYSEDEDITLYAIWEESGNVPLYYVFFRDDGADEDVHRDIALMGNHNNGNDASISFDLHNTSQKISAKESLFFSYTPKSKTHWSGLMFLLHSMDLYPDGSAIPFRSSSILGPDLSKFTKLTFCVKGNGGHASFFYETNGGEQVTKDVFITDKWQKVVLDVDESFLFCNILWGFTCDNSSLEEKNDSVAFWVDDIKFE